MFCIAIRRALLLGCLIVSPVMAAPVADASPHADGSPAETVVADMGHRLDALQGLLDAVRDAKGEPLRQAAMERHWKAMQDYMAASLKRTIQDPSTAPGSSNCEIVGGAWKGLSFPGQVPSGTYLKDMQAQMGRMRMELLGLHDARDAQALDLALRSHWRRNYEFLQGMRGLGWMFGSWTPGAPGDRHLPDPESAGAQLTQGFCSVCHAVPQARLHTAAEWDAVMTTMVRHIALSDGGMPICVQMPTDVELEEIGDYFEKYAR